MEEAEQKCVNKTLRNAVPSTKTVQGMLSAKRYSENWFGLPQTKQPEKPHGGCGSVSPAYYKRCLNNTNPNARHPRKDYEGVARVNLVTRRKSARIPAHETHFGPV
ncbi:hypothetical protein H4Q26_010134 [Puccinia striiformis f. sp. tritici PST-130]|nr:hypothetical protein H4Q26_010134 [Puccinia striiformis f. sp. tritici PST-130]